MKALFQNLITGETICTLPKVVVRAEFVLKLNQTLIVLNFVPYLDYTSLSGSDKN